MENYYFGIILIWLNCTPKTEKNGKFYVIFLNN